MVFTTLRGSKIEKGQSRTHGQDDLVRIVGLDSMQVVRHESSNGGLQKGLTLATVVGQWANYGHRSILDPVAWPAIFAQACENNAFESTVRWIIGYAFVQTICDCKWIPVTRLGPYAQSVQLLACIG
jgi:hypothetical protein